MIEPWLRINQVLLGQAGREDVLKEALALICIQGESAAALLYLADLDRNRLVPFLGHALDAAALPSVAIGDGLAGEAASSLRACVATQAAAESPWIANMSLLTVLPQEITARPLLCGQELLGVLVTAALSRRVPETRALEEAMVGSLALALAHDLLARRTEHFFVVDPATGLFKEPYLIQRLESEFSRAFRYEFHLSVMILSPLDAGGRPPEENLRRLVLSAAGKALAATLRDSDICGRYGEEHILIALPHTSRQQVRAVADKIRTAVGEALEGLLPGGEIVLGGATYPDSNALALSELLAKADEAHQRAAELAAERTMVV